MLSGVVRNICNGNFADFRDLVLILPEAANGGASQDLQESTCARVSS